MNRTLAFLPMLLLALASCGENPQSKADYDACKSGPSADQRIAACTRLIASGQLSSPDLANVHHNRGVALAGKREYDRAIADYNEALRINPLYVIAYYHRFMAQNNRGDSVRATATRKETPPPAGNPTDAKGYNKRGIAWAEKRDYDRAIADYNEALRIDPKYQFAYYNRGISWAGKRDYDRAIADYNEALRINPKDADAYHNRGVAWSNKQDHDRAIADYGEALRINPQNAKIYYNRAVAWGNKRDYERAIADYSEALRINPQDAKAYNNRGLAWANSKRDWDRAIADYNEALRFDPKDSLAYNNRGTAWRNKRDYERAIADYSEALRINPQYSLAYYNRGIAWADKRDYERAITDYNEALRINPQYLSANNTAAWLLATAPVAAVRNGARAVELARKAAELSDWKDGDILDTLAAAYAEAGNFPEAVRWQGKALEFPDFMKTQGDDARKRLELYRKGQPYHQS